MRNLFKKALAFCLVAALALTCFAGSFSAAEPYTATISVDSQTITQGTESVDVVLNISSPDAGINEALIKVSSDLGTVTGVAVNDDANATIDYATDDGDTVSDYGSFYLSANNTSDGENGTVLGSITNAAITVTFAVAADIAIDSYDIIIDIPSDKVIAASKDEEVINFAYNVVDDVSTPASVSVEEAVTETYTVTFVDADGTVLKTEDVAPNAAATAPDVVDDFTTDNYFTGWDKDFSAITEDTTVTAQYITINFRVRSRYLKLEDAIRYALTVGTTTGSLTDENIVEFGIMVWDASETEYAIETATVIPRTEDTYYDSTNNRYELLIDKTSVQMADEFTARAYAKLTNGTIIYGRSANAGDYQYHTASVKNYAETQINGSATTNMKNLLTALLVYGAKAQTAFNVNTENLADAGLTDDQKSAIEAQVATLEASYGYLDPDANTTLDNVATSRIRSASLDLKSNTLINYGADLSGDPKASQISEVYILTWSEDAYNTIIATDENGLVYGTETGCELTTINTSNGRYYADSYPLKSNEVFDDVYARAYVKYADGTEGYTSVLKYSVEYYCQNGIASTSANHTAALKVLYNALMVYGEYAIINFG